MARLLFAACLLYLASPSIADPIYVTRDKSGNPVFSDQASEDAEEIEVQETMTYDSSDFMKDYNKSQAATAAEDPEEFQYQRLTVSTLNEGEVVRDNEGNLELHLVIEPHLRRGHTIALVMDGVTIRTVTKTGSQSLENVDRGTHHFHLQVIRSVDQTELQVGPSTSVNVFRQSVIRRNSSG